jgi:hypothetical protein
MNYHPLLAPKTISWPLAGFTVLLFMFAAPGIAVLSFFFWPIEVLK